MNASFGQRFVYVNRNVPRRLKESWFEVEANWASMGRSTSDVNSPEAGMEFTLVYSPKYEWPRSGGTIGKNRGVRHSVKLSIGERTTRVKLLEEISLPSLLK